MPERVQLRRTKGWKMPRNTVSVARPGPWGNPFKVGRDGTRAECFDLYIKLMAGFICLGSGASVADQRKTRSHAMRNIKKLRGKNLACWCAKDGKRCHADLLLRLAAA